MTLYTKLIFFTLIIGVFMTGFIQLGSEITNNSNLDEGTQEYLNSIDNSISNIENIEVTQTNVSTGSEDSFSKQYLESKAYAQNAGNMIKVFGDTPNILITSFGLEEEKTGWFTSYLFIGVSVLLSIVFFTLLFGRGRM